MSNLLRIKANMLKLTVIYLYAVDLAYLLNIVAGYLHNNQSLIYIYELVPTIRLITNIEQWVMSV